MRIERIELDGFGRFHDASWELPAGLTVLLGANEAGKTTLLNALRALLFGFESSRDGRAWYPALGGGRRGGRLVLRTQADERWVVERHGDRGGGGALAVRAPSGNQGGQETLDRLLHGADKDLYNNIFAFGLGELQTFASLSADGVRGRIYGARAGLGGTSAIDLERRLRAEMDATFLPGGSKRPLNALFGRIETLRAEIATLARQPEEHADAHRERARQADAAAAARDEARVLRERLARQRSIRDAAPVVAQLDVVRGELAAGDASLDDLGPEVAAALDRHLAECDQARAVLDTIDEGLRDARRERETAAPEEEILAAAAEIASLLDERPRRHADMDRRRDLEAAAVRADATVREQLDRSGGMTEGALLALDDSIPTVEATREREAALATARATRAEAAARVRALGDELDAADRSMGVGDAGLDGRLAAFRELQALRLERAASRESSGPARLDVGLMAAAGAVAVGVLVGLQVGATAVGVALGLAAGIGLYLLLRRQATPGATDRALDERLASLSRTLDLPPDAPAADVIALGERLATERARRDLATADASRSEARRQELARREQELADADAALQAEERRWCAWLEGRALPIQTSPEAARQLLGAAGIARRAATERDSNRERMSVIEDAAARYAARVDALIVSLGMRAARDDGQRDAQLVGVGERLQASRDAQRRAVEIDARVAQLGDRRAAAAADAENADERLASFLTAAGTADPDAFRARAAASERRRELRADERELRERLIGIAGGASALAALEDEARAADATTLDVAAADLAAALEDAELREREASAAIGAIDARIAQLEATGELGDRRQELAQLEGQAQAMAREWAIRALAHRLLSITRARHERERQPDVVRAAEEHFERITGGRYARIIAPPGEATVRVETESGESRSTDELSRGTGEQLYLALRFGLIEEFAGHAEALPVVMDDILVNFDADRARRAAAAIGQLAERHQVLYFTCHPWTAELLDPEGDRTLGLN